MGFLDNAFPDIGGFIGKLGETLQDAGWFIGAPAAAAFDITKAGLDTKQPFVKTAISEVTKGFSRGTQLFFGDENDPNNPNDNVDNLLSPSVKKVTDGLEWVYKNAISQPLNTGLITGQRVAADIAGVQDDASPLDVGSAWDRADSLTGGYDHKGTSLGREAVFWQQGIAAALMGNDRVATQMLTDDGQRQIEQHSKMFDVNSGALDAGARLFLDPTILLGKATKTLRAAKAIAAIKDPTQITSKLNELKGGLTKGDGLFAGWGARHAQAVDFAAQPGRNAGELMAAFPVLKTATDGPATASIMEQANKSLYAAGKSKAEVAEQIGLITRASVGDADALLQISGDTKFAADALAAMKSNRDDLKTASEWATQYSDRVTPDDIAEAATHLNLVQDLTMRGKDYFTSDEFIRMTDERLKAVSHDVRAAEDEYARQKRVADKFIGTKETPSIAGFASNRPMLSSALGSTKGLEKRAALERGDYKSLPTRALNAASDATGTGFIFQSTAFNKGIRIVAAVGAPHIYLGSKAVGAFNKLAQPREISVHDPHAAVQLDTFLKHSKLDSEERLALVGKLAAARDENQKGQIVETAIQRATESIVADHKAKNPFFTDEMEKLVNISLQKEGLKTSARTAAHTQMFTAAKTVEDKPGIPAGSRGDLVIGDDGVAEFHPILETQKVNRFGLPDLRRTAHVLTRHSNWMTDMAEWAKGNRAPDPNRISAIASRVFDTTAEKFPGFDVRTANKAQAVNDFVWKSEEFAKATLDGFNHIWKAATLGLRPVSYAARVNIESAMRMVATLGPTAWMSHALPRAVGMSTLGTATGARMFRMSYLDNQRELELTKGMERLEDAHAAETGEKLAEGQNPLYDQMKAERDTTQARLNQYRTGGRQGRLAAYGKFGEAGHKSIQTRAGEITGAFDDEQGRIDKWRIASDTSAQVIGDTTKIALKGAQLGNWSYIKPGEPLHMENWLNAVNAQLLQSTIGKKAVQYMVEYKDAAKATDRLARWATGTPEGRDIMGRLQWTWADKRQGAGEVVGYVNHYLPSEELQAKAAKAGRVKQTDLETAVPNVEDRPPVHGESVAISTGRGSVVGEQVNRTFGAILRWAGDATEDQLARHPMYAAVYEQEAKRRAEFLLADPRIDKVTLGDIQTMVKDQAHKAGREAVKKYMYDVAATSDLSHFSRFVSPFIAAWEDTVRKWGRIAVEDPSIAGKAYLVWNAPNDMGLVVDANGNHVDQDTFTDKTYVVVPHGITKHLPGFLGGGGDTDFKISKQSFNLVLQGGLSPGFGPLVAYPTARLQTAAPELNDIAKVVNPYGPDTFFNMMAPSTVKDLRNALDSQSKAHMQDTTRIYGQMLADYRIDPQKFGGKEPNIDDAAKRAGALGRLKVLSRMVNPFPPIFQSPYQLYMDAYRTLNERERSEGHPQGWADDQFIKGYGDSYFPLVQSESLNNAGLGSSAEAVDASNRYKSLIAKYGVEAGAANPQLVRLIVGPEGEGDFNESAHQWQETREISPASGLNYRSYDNPQAAAASADAKLGWLKYRQFTNQLDARALEQGFQTYRDDPELVDERKQFIANLESENQAWHVDFSTFDSDKFDRQLKALGEISTSGKFGPMRTDMVGVRDYLALRQALGEQLQEAGVTAGSAEAQPFRQEFTDAVQSLVSKNTQFAEFSYYSFLERDPLLEPVQADGTSQPTDWGISS
jgi:hypothetical protein